MSGSTCGLGAGPPSVEIPARPRTALLGNVRRYGHLLPVCEWFICRTVQHHFAQRSAYACPAILELTEGTSGEGDIPSVGRPLLVDGRSEEHTSELQSLMRISYAVFCLKKK